MYSGHCTLTVRNPIYLGIQTKGSVITPKKPGSTALLTLLYINLVYYQTTTYISKNNYNSNISSVALQYNNNNNNSNLPNVDIGGVVSGPEYKLRSSVVPRADVRHVRLSTNYRKK